MVKWLLVKTTPVTFIMHYLSTDTLIIPISQKLLLSKLFLEYARLISNGKWPGNQ